MAANQTDILVVGYRDVDGASVDLALHEHAAFQAVGAGAAG
jgi:hypothetical protein